MSLVRLRPRPLGRGRGTSAPVARLRRTAAIAVGVVAVMVGSDLAAAPQVDPRPEKRPGMVSEVAGALVIDAPRARFDDAYESATVTHRFPFRNRGAKPVVIEQALALAPGGTVEASPRVVPPGGSGEIVVRQSLTDVLGLVTFRYALVTDEPGVSRYRVLLSGFVQSAYEPERAFLDLGGLDCGIGGAGGFELFSREVERLEVVDISGVPDGVRVRVTERAGDAEEGVRIRVELAGGGMLGTRTGRFQIRTNVPQQPTFDIGFRANVFCDLVPAESPVVLGLANEGQEVTHAVELVSRSGRPVKIDRAVDPTEVVNATLVPCGEERDSCVGLRLRIDSARRGGLNGTVLVYETAAAEPIPLAYTGLVVGAEKVVKKVELADLSEGAAESRPPLESRPAPATAADASRDTAPPVVPAAAAPPAAEPVPRQAVLRWVARDEAEVYGYLVYRSPRREGPYTRVNARVVPVVADGATVHAYELVDRNVEAGATYFYYLDLVTQGGSKKRFSGVVEKRIPPGTTDGAATKPTAP